MILGRDIPTQVKVNPMSGIGHFAPAFAAKPITPRASLWVLLIAAETNDLLYFLFTSIGIEPKVAITMDFNQGVKHLTPVSYPWSHGLLMSIVWAVIAAALALLFYRDRRTSITVGLVVFSHWLLDFLMHSNLPLFFDGSPQVGLGLENSGTGFLFMTIFDILLFIAGLAIYLISRKRASQN